MFGKRLYLLSRSLTSENWLWKQLNSSICEFDKWDVNEKGEDSKERWGGGGKHLGEAISTTEDTFYYLYPLSISHFMFVNEKESFMHFFMQRRSLSSDHSTIVSYLHSTSRTSRHVPFQILKGSIDRWYEPPGLYFKGKKKGVGEQRKKIRNSTYRPLYYAKT
jgi:hypothetical protein